MEAGSPERLAEEKEIQLLRNMPENTFAVGSFISTNKIDGWVKERLSGLNKNVKYVHNKFMLVDPLSNKPVVIAGSANFSEASTRTNDENMIVVAATSAWPTSISASSCVSTATTRSVSRCSGENPTIRRSRCGRTIGGRTISARRNVRYAAGSSPGALVQSSQKKVPLLALSGSQASPQDTFAKRREAASASAERF